MTTSISSDVGSNSGFIYSMDRGMARRQFQLSLGMIVMIGMAIVAAACTVHTASDADRGYTASLPGPMIHAERPVVQPDRI